MPGGVPEGAPVALSLAARWRDLALDGHLMIAVDMPIGLAERGPRACDIAARRVLPRGRKSSVFPPPRRAMLGCADWAEANALGATMIFNTRFETSSISKGQQQSVGSVEVLAYGTAVIP